MPVPRLCPAGYVCDVTGVVRADQPCPAGHFCLAGTATTATTCGHARPSGELFPSLIHAERHSTAGHGQRRKSEAPGLVLGARNAGCFANRTDDMGLQLSDVPGRFWQERHLLPLDETSPFTPHRGRYCLDDSCLRLEDADDVTVADPDFDYQAYGANLRRPVPCPPGQFCGPGTANIGRGTVRAGVAARRMSGRRTAA